MRLHHRWLAGRLRRAERDRDALMVRTCSRPLPQQRLEPRTVLAAGALLVTEAGGVVCDFTGGNDFLTSNQVIAGSAVVAAELAAVLGQYAVSAS